MEKIKEFFSKVKAFFMNENLLQFGKVFAMFVMAFIALIPNVEIWNMASQGNTDGFHVVVSILNFIMEGGLLYMFAKKILFKKA